jgi:SAM-dependent methyltransferase
MTALAMLASDQEEIELLESHIERLYDGRTPLKILEAGCGPRWPLRLRGVSYRLTGVDLDGEALQRRQRDARDLDETILGDLRQVEFAPGSFDVIYNAFVLEHIDNAALVLEKFSRWLRPGGLLMLMLPDRDSVFGFLTRMTPFWFHVLYHRWILERAGAGRPGFGPYPTYYDRVVSRNGIREFCRSHRFAVNEERGVCTYAMQNGARAQLVRAVARAVSALSLGTLPWRHNNLTYVLRKR